MRLTQKGHRSVTYSAKIHGGEKKLNKRMFLELLHKADAMSKAWMLGSYRPNYLSSYNLIWLK